MQRVSGKNYKCEINNLIKKERKKERQKERKTERKLDLGKKE